MRPDDNDDERDVLCCPDSRATHRTPLFLRAPHRARTLSPQACPLQLAVQQRRLVAAVVALQTLMYQHWPS